MRRRLMILSLIAALLALVAPALAQDVQLFVTCIDRSQPDRVIVHFGYFASATVDGTGYLAPLGNFGGDLPPNTLLAGQHDGVFYVEIYGATVWQFVSDNTSLELWVDRDTSGPDCANLNQPAAAGTTSIPIVMTSDCAFIDICDAYDNWHRVGSNGEAVLLRYGQALIGGPGQSSNAGDYRAVATDCPG